MALESLLYISESKIEPCDAKSEVKHILATAHAFNPSVGITGALLFTGTHFAQVIEGEQTAICELIAAITRDRRHNLGKYRRAGASSRAMVPRLEHGL